VKLMRWLWFVAGTTVRVVGRGTWKLHSARLISGVLFSGLAALFSYVATGRSSAWLGVLAYPGGLVLIYGFELTRFLTGWRWRFDRESPIQPDSTIQITLLERGPQGVSPTREREEVSCVIWDPKHQRFPADHTQGHVGYAICLYPGWFSGAPKVTAGTYWILWQERKPIWRNGQLVDMGKWLPVDFSRIKITEQQLAAASPTAPSASASAP
jgi:hypothetical protein